MRKFIIFSCSSLPLLLLVAQNAYSASPSDVRPFSAVTVGDYLAACKIHPNTCISEVGTALMNKTNFAGAPTICLQSVDYAVPVPKWLSSHPDTRQMPTEDGIYLALKSLYPCE